MAGGESRRFHRRLLHERPGDDPRRARGRDRRAAARGSDPRFHARQAGGARRGCARLLDIGRRPERLCLVRGSFRSQSARRHDPGVCGCRPRVRPLDRGGGWRGRATRGAPLKFASTRDGSLAVSLSEALRRGLAPDGGLYIPRAIPSVDARTIDGGSPIAALAAGLLAPYFADDALESFLAAIAAESLDFDAPLRPVEDGVERLSMLELFHGPTAAFKDFGARFLAACFARLRSPGEPALTILVATSGDTGSAVAAAFDGRAGIRVVLL